MAKFKVEYEYTSQYEATVIIPDDEIAMWIEDGVDIHDTDQYMDAVTDHIIGTYALDPSFDDEVGHGDWGDMDFHILEPYNPNHGVTQIPGQEELNI